jgi:UPF0271 protein
MLKIDLNCDMGEGYPDDERLMPYISSANIACGIHSGSIDIMKKTVELAVEHGVAVGAHPSYPDRANFGRIDMLGSGLNLEDLLLTISDQITQIEQICAEFGSELHHVKLHGALYNRAAWDTNLSQAICQAMKARNKELIFYGLSGSEMGKQADIHQVKFLHEVFADRTYTDNGSLTPRSAPNSMIADDQEAAQRVLRMLQRGIVTTTSGRVIPIKAETVCIHGDTDQALKFAITIHGALERNGISISRPSF